MSEFERCGGKLYNIEPTLQNMTVVEQIDDYQMKIYELMKHTYPQMVGYTAECLECIDENGSLDIQTKFFMLRPEGGEE